MPLPKAVQMAAERGWSVIPVRTDKRPAVKSWKEFQETPATVEQLDKWSRFSTVKGWAVVTGKVSSLVILDFDGEAGKKVLKDLKLRSHVTTGSGGAHVYFEHPGWPVPTLNSKSSGDLKKRWPGLDIRADGGYAVFWGENQSGRYRWLRKAELEKLDVLPSDLRTFLHLAKPVPQPKPASNDTGQTSADLPGRLLDMALNMARAEGRNNAGFWYACQLRDNRVPEQFARGLMERYAAAVPSTNTKGKHEPYTAAEALTSLGEAYRSAARDPIPQKKQRGTKQSATPQPQAGPLPAAPPQQEQQEPILISHGAYCLAEGGLRYVRPNREGSSSNLILTNFPAVIVADIERDDGVEKHRAFKVWAKIKGQPREAMMGHAEFTEMGWPMKYFGSDAIVYPNFKEHARTAMQELSREKTFQYVYQHTGWAEINGKPVFLHAGGGIGVDGPMPDLMIDLDPQLSLFHLPAPPAGRELTRSIRASLAMLEVVPDRLMLPLFSAIWRVVLAPVDVAIHLSGKSGNGKSELAALAQQHFGKDFIAKKLPANWDSTANSLQGLSFYAKNVLLTVDDFVPRGSASDISRLHRDADRLIRAQGNQQGRGRMNADGSQRQTLWPRGMIISTGEDIPKGNSCRARMVIVEMDPDDMNWNRLTDCQADAANGLYAQSMAGFIQWAAPQMPTMKKRLFEQLARFREDWSGIQQHRRTPDNLANLSFGLEVFLEYARERGALTHPQAAEIWARAMEAYREAAEAQERTQEHAEPTQLFLSLVYSALSSGQAHLVTRDGLEPENPASAGWKKENGTWRPQGPKIGWDDGETILLDPASSFAAAQRLGKEIQDQIPVTLQTLARRLKQRRILTATDLKRETTTIRKICEDTQRAVWAISQGSLYAEKCQTNPTSDIGDPS